MSFHLNNDHEQKSKFFFVLSSACGCQTPWNQDYMLFNSNLWKRRVWGAFCISINFNNKSIDIMKTKNFTFFTGRLFVFCSLVSTTPFHKFKCISISFLQIWIKKNLGGFYGPNIYKWYPAHSSFFDTFLIKIYFNRLTTVVFCFHRYRHSCKHNWRNNRSPCFLSTPN